MFIENELIDGKGSLVLNTFRNVLNNDSLWFSLLRAIQIHFRYKTISSAQLISFINEKTQTDYTYFFEQYLNHRALPKLEIRKRESGADLVIDYRWQCDVPKFRMPIKITTAIDHFEFIFPTTEWESTTIANMQEEHFEVDENDFFDFPRRGGWLVVFIQAAYKNRTDDLLVSLDAQS